VPIADIGEMAWSTVTALMLRCTTALPVDVAN
jgi:hypothetical protein